eukprot:CAMPEP_0195008506 /NCGR_PEP_ID=MMETSP0326_2-20130528/8515_1 /TAXON_ID=2866 ORGANISM="Crypthecodinium cohnii, Strain Seligo" /NCGR_SAMPLE_ID=MMETSP0326_2 /ASSEMBLY_ACC=CAM_ASM_000348 /LENGTH=39 /DNA_ID= /DNA_START= /DNA_END= /DNA_ORIENTATION=
MSFEALSEGDRQIKMLTLREPMGLVHGMDGETRLKMSFE